MARAFIALGSNLEQPKKQLQRAFDELAALPETALTRRSTLYRSAPVGYDNQPEFINAVAEVETRLEPLDLLDQLFDVENMHGRERPFPNAPRILDLDLLMYDDKVMATDRLTLPHPRMHERGFVLLPLAEIAPDLTIPGHGKVSDLAETCINQDVERIAA